MIKTIEEFKELILWCKKHKVKSISLGETSVEVSEIAFIDDIPTYEPEITTAKNKIEDSTTLAELDQDKEDDELLFWSAD